MVDVEASFLDQLTAGFRTNVEIGIRRCSDVFFDFSSMTVHARENIEIRDEENERLRKMVTQLQQRVETLETIATDPAERTAREIESLRAVPVSKSDTSD